MSSTHQYTPTLLALTGVAISFQFVQGKTMPQSQCDFFGIARQFISERYPTFDTAGLRPIISETESRPIEITM